MEKFNSSSHNKYIKNLPFSFFSLPLYLDFSAYVFERNGETIIVWQGIPYPHDFPSIFMPEKKENWERFSVTLASAEDAEKVKNENIELTIQVPVETEYFYKTEHFIDPKKKMRAHIENFKKLYSYKIFNNYQSDKILEFYKQWKNQRERFSVTVTEEENFFMFCLNNLDKYPIRQIYIEVDNKLVGFAWGIDHPRGGWVGLELKADYSYKGLSRLLQNERAKMFLGHEFFSLGTGCHDKGIIEYKKELGPVFTKEYIYLLTKDKIK